MATDTAVLAKQVVQDLLDIDGTAAGLTDNGARLNLAPHLKEFQDAAGLPVTEPKVENLGGKTFEILDQVTQAKITEILGVPQIEALEKAKQAQIEAARSGRPATAAEKEASRRIAAGVVASDEHAVHGVRTALTAPTTLASAGVGAAIGFFAAGPLGAGIGALVGGAVEHYRIAGGPVGKLSSKFGLFKKSMKKN